MITKKLTRWASRGLLWAVYSFIFASNCFANDAEKLDKLSIEELMDSKVVSATRTEQQLTDTAAAAYVITQDDIRRSGATTIPEALRMVPGLHVARISASKWAISARGFNGLVADKILVLMDGRSLYSPVHKGTYWDIQDRVLDDIERIEVIRGPGASVWGANAVNGVINIITKHTDETKEGSVTLFGGDKYGAGLRKGWQFSDQGYARVYGKFLRDETFTNTIGNDANEEWTSGRGGFRMDWANSDGKHALMVQGDVFHGIQNENLDKANQPLTNKLALNRVTKTGGNLMARWNYNQSLASRMSAQFFYDTVQVSESFLNPSTLNSDVIDFDFQHVFAFNEANELTWGLNYRLSLVQLKTLNSPIITEYFPKTFENNRFSFYIQDKWRWDDEVELTLGSKFEHHNNNNFEYEPSLRILWKPASQHRVWGGIARAVRLPAVSDLLSDETRVPGQISTAIFQFHQYQKMASDEVVSYELGYRYWDSDRFSLDVAAYYNQYNQNLVANNEFLNWFPERSIKKSTALGVEATLAWHPVDMTRFQISTSFIDFDIKSKRIVDGLSLGRTSQDPRFMFAFRGAFDITKDIEADFWLRYVASAAGVQPTQTIPSYVTLDARLAWKPNKNLELAFIANNLNDSQHTEFYEGIYPNPLQVERLFWVQGKLKF